MMRSDLSGKTVLVTGAGGAIGSSMAAVLGANGAAVAVCDIVLANAEKTAAAIREAGGKAKAYYFDVTDPECAARVADEIENDFGGIDILINNAGVNVGPNDRKPLHEFSPEKWEWILSIDLDGVFKVTKAVVPHIIKRGGGSVINISSVVGQVPFRNQCAFTAAKAGVINLSKAMALRICPGKYQSKRHLPRFHHVRGNKGALLCRQGKGRGYALAYPSAQTRLAGMTLPMPRCTLHRTNRPT